MAKVTNEPTAKRYAQLANCLNDTQTTNARIGVQQFIRQIKQLRQKIKHARHFLVTMVYQKKKSKLRSQK